MTALRVVARSMRLREGYPAYTQGSKISQTMIYYTLAVTLTVIATYRTSYCYYYYHPERLT